MTKKYNAIKFIEMIKATENKVSEMYTNLSEKVRDEKAKNLLLKLAADEKMHENMYASILGKVPAGGELDLSEDEIEYTETLIGTNLFFSHNAKHIYGKMNALAIAEKIERDSILYYTQMMKLFPDTMHDELELILAQEKKHLKYVQESQFLSMMPSLML
jgi:rubrerythrin